MKNIILILLIIAAPKLLFAQKETTDSTAKSWAFSLQGYYYFVPDEDSYLLPILTADYRSLHLEARYNYEDFNTASTFAGWRWETGKNLKFTATPMLGIAFGNTNGLVPALELELGYKAFDFYSESEYLIDFSSKENNFAYTYSELGITYLKDHFRSGITGQRTRLFDAAKEYAPGIFTQYYFLDRFSTGIFYYHPFSINNYAFVSLSVDF